GEKGTRAQEEGAGQQEKGARRQEKTGHQGGNQKIMSSPRGQANHGLYLARVLLAAWRRDLAAEDIPASVLAQAVGPAVRGHLLDAYGWFLLDLQKPAQLPATPP